MATLAEKRVMNKLTAIECFVRTVEYGSFSATARELGIGQPHVSRNIASLERSLGARLLHRSSRGVVLTQEGQRYYAQARLALDVIERAESEARGENNPQGLLRVSCAQTLGTELIVDALPAFLQRYPDVDVDLQLTDAYSDLMTQGLDLAIRGGVLLDSALRAQHIGNSQRVYLASKAYLDAHGNPGTPQDLAHHQCILYSHMTRPDIWVFDGIEIRVAGRMRMNNLDGIRRAALNGMGIAYLPSWMVGEQLRSGAIQMVLPAHMPRPTPVHAVYLTHKLLPQRAVVFIDYLASLFDATPGLSKRDGALSQAY
jgi:LysR family transcriptional regulator for bpeEF and oprC